MTEQERREVIEEYKAKQLWFERWKTNPTPQVVAAAKAYGSIWHNKYFMDITWRVMHWLRKKKFMDVEGSPVLNLYKKGRLKLK